EMRATAAANAFCAPFRFGHLVSPIKLRCDVPIAIAPLRCQRFETVEKSEGERLRRIGADWRESAKIGVSVTCPACAREAPLPARYEGNRRIPGSLDRFA